MLKPATIKAERFKELMIDKAIPAIKARTPRPPAHTIFVQQDVAKPRTGGGVMEANQQLKEDVGVSSPEDLVETTMEAFDVYPQETLERVWQSLFAAHGEVVASKGDNSYKLPHLGKENLGRTGKLPVNGRVDEEKYRIGNAFLEASG
ncbi:unnamed protein product, partial [Discosporangium mesarthrocarpum]